MREVAPGAPRSAGRGRRVVACMGDSTEIACGRLHLERREARVEGDEWHREHDGGEHADVWDEVEEEGEHPKGEEEVEADEVEDRT